MEKIALRVEKPIEEVKPIEEAKPDELTVAKTRKPRVKQFDPVEAVISKYTEMAWTCVRTRAINDIVAHKDKRLHFIQVVTPDNIEDAKYHGLAKNTFIQNAFANSAIPIFAHVVTSTVKNELRVKVTFEDVNTNTRVIIGSAKKPVE